MKLITIIDSIFLLIGLPANGVLMIAILMATTKEIKTYSIIQFIIALCDLTRVSSEFMVQERIVFEWPFTVFIYNGPCVLAGEKLCWFFQRLFMNFFFYVAILITFSIWYRNAALKGYLPGSVCVCVTMFTLWTPMIVYMYTFTIISRGESSAVILSTHPNEDVSALVFVGMSAHDVTPFIFTISTVIFPIPAYIVLKTISRSSNMSFKTKKMHESFMKALLYTVGQPTFLFGALIITFAQNMKLFEPTEFSESTLTLCACLSSMSNPLATLFFVKQYKNFVLRSILRKISTEVDSIARKDTCNVVQNEMRCCLGSKKEFELKSEEKKDVKKWTWAEWKRPVVAVILTFLCNVESSMLAVGEWPYMTTIDHDATSSFYGIAVAVSKAGHAVFAFLFAIWAYKISGIRIPMLVGRCITLTACIMYIFVEFIPVNRRWWMFACYLLFGIGFGTSPLLRSYIARVTSEENRSTAYALQNGAGVLSVIVGPPTPFALAAIKERFARLRSLNLPWILIGIVIFEKVVSDLATSTMSSVAGPVMTVMYSFTGSKAVLIVAVAQVIVGCLALALSLLFFLCQLGRYVSCRFLFVLSTVIVIIGYVITYPFPFSSSPMQPFNETTRTGCSPEQYSWCDTQLIVNIIPYLIILIITNSFAIPSAALSLDTIYSKMIGNIDQNLMQSLFVISDDIIQIVGPIYGAEVFSAVGLNLIHIINGVVYIVGTVVWLITWRWLRPYN